MFKSNKEMLAELMPDENTVLILKKDLQLRHGILTKGTRVILRYGGYCGSWYDIISSNGCYIKSNTLYLNEMISEKGEYILSEDIPKYSQRIQKFVREYFIIDIDRTKEYNDILEKKPNNFGMILFTLFWLAGLIVISIFGWVDGAWCDSYIFSILSGNVLVGILNNLIFGTVWCIVALMGITFLGYEQMVSIERENEKKICQLLS